MPEPETFEVLPWDRKVARVWCTCFRNREEREDPGAFLTSDCRSNLKQIQAAFEEEHGLHLRAGTEPEMMWLNLKEDGTPDVSGEDEAVLLPHRPVQRAAADHPQGDRVRPGARARHDPGRPRGRARPDRAQLQLRPRRADRGQPLDVPAGLPPGRARAQRVPVLHAEAVHGRLRERLPPQHLALARRRERVHAARARTSRSRARSASGRSAASSSTSAPSPRSRRSTVNSYRRLWDTGFWAPVFADWGYPEPHDRAARVGAGPVRVPLGRLGRQPVPLDGGADQGDGGRDRAQARPRPSPRSATSTRRWRPARRSRRSR